MFYFRYPNQLIQFALNEPEDSLICQAARAVVDTLDISYVDWVTKPDGVDNCQATIQPPAVVNCSAISLDGQLLALGSEDCRVHVYSLANCEVWIDVTCVQDMFTTSCCILQIKLPEIVKLTLNVLLAKGEDDFGYFMIS